MGKLYYALMLGDWLNTNPGSPTGQFGRENTVQIPPSEPDPVENTILDKMYNLAHKLFDHLLGVLDFPHVTGRTAANGVTTHQAMQTTAKAVNNDYSKLWPVAKSYFDILLDVAIPIATLFFIIAIYNAVVSTPPEEHPKRFIMNTIRYAVVIVVATNVFNILTCVTEITEDATDAVLEATQPASTNDYKFTYDDNSPIRQAIKRRSSKPIDIKKFTQGKVLVFLDSVFEYVTLFLGAVLTLISFAVSAFTIAMAGIQRIVKPLMMLPFSTIVVGMSACEDEGERTLMNYLKALLSFCMSAVAIVISIKIGAALSSLNLIHLGKGLPGKSTVAALAEVVNINLPVVITTGLVKSSEGFMNKVFS